MQLDGASLSSSFLGKHLYPYELRLVRGIAKVGSSAEIWIYICLDLSLSFYWYPPALVQGIIILCLLLSSLGLKEQCKRRHVYLLFNLQCALYFMQHFIIMCYVLHVCFVNLYLVFEFFLSWHLECYIILMSYKHN